MKATDIWPLKTCTFCRVPKPITEFGTQSWIRDLLFARCKKCISAINKIRRKNNTRQQEADRKYNLRYHNRGMTVEKYDQLLESQNGKCAICKNLETARRRNGTIKRLAVDHSHKTDRNRGLLCGRCNVAIGYFRESAELLKAAITYLQKYEH